MVIVEEPSLSSTIEKVPELWIATVLSVSRFVAVPTNGPAPKISPSLKTKKFRTSGAVKVAFLTGGRRNRRNRRDRHTGSSRTAHTLNSGIRLTGSSAGFVTRFAAPSAPKWNGMNTVS